MVKELCGYLLHPKIQYDKSNVRVADIGTGTGSAEQSISLCERPSSCPS